MWRDLNLLFDYWEAGEEPGMDWTLDYAAMAIQEEIASSSQGSQQVREVKH